MAHFTLQELEDEALSLPLERSEDEIREQWILEAERRAEEMRSGRVQGEPVKDVLARIRARLA